MSTCAFALDGITQQHLAQQEVSEIAAPEVTKAPHSTFPKTPAHTTGQDRVDHVRMKAPMGQQASCGRDARDPDPCHT
jgi:hypothetical protein